ncbi:hypothetical protein ACJ72_05835 [Emergomyces africanus]|uniref:chitinase n=1 Tax=Emergomyces africanus TaxID=1955775 RepID=A0A1B7NSQ3_9EURO|nr:hypothetical protein ACJ72_05835 [Emergomyces africanus]
MPHVQNLDHANKAAVANTEAVGLGLSFVPPTHVCRRVMRSRNVANTHPRDKKNAHSTFCGTTNEFCGKGCENGCKEIKRPSCSGASTRGRYVGYFESWNYDHACDVLHPSKINTNPWTHLNFGFAQINPKDSTLTTMHVYDKEFYRAFTDLKMKKPSLKSFISIGGWDAGGKVYSDMAKSDNSRKAFIASVIGFLEKYGFDGVDIDWEYPVADDRGGAKEDFKTYVQLLKELRAALGEKYGLTVALPASYWYLRGYDLKGMVEYIDWFNVMAYDIHGTWDGNSIWTQTAINPHTNLTAEISLGLDLLWRNSVPPEKVNLGLGFYGRSFTLADPSCTTPGCPFKKGDHETSGGAQPGLCTLNSGTLSDYEINRILKEKSPEVIHNQDAGVNWITWDKDQWVSYDDGRTLKQKADLGNKLCLGGTVAWAVDLGGPGTLKNPNDMSADDLGLGGADLQGADGGSGEVYISSDILKKQDPVIACIPPCTFIMPPISFGTPTTIILPPYTTSLEIAWPTTHFVTLPGGSVATTTGLARTIQTTTLTIPPITTSKVDLWNWKVTNPEASNATYALISSILPPPFVITDKLPEDWVKGNPPKPTPGNANPSVKDGNPKNSQAATAIGGYSVTGSDNPSLIEFIGNTPKVTSTNSGQPTHRPDDTHRHETESLQKNPEVITSAGDDSTLRSHVTDKITDSPVTTRTITPPPFPYTTETDDKDEKKLPTVVFTRGPPDPVCTANCGKKCEGRFCDEPCEHDCGDGEDFISENETVKPKNTQKCRGPDCKNGKCSGLFCISFGCFGLGCLDGICWGPACVITWCMVLDVNQVGVLGWTAITIQVDVSARNVWVLAAMALIVIMGAARAQNAGLLHVKERVASRDFAQDPITKSEGPEKYFSTTYTGCSTITACSAQPTTVTTTTTIEKPPMNTATAMATLTIDTPDHYMALAQYLVYKMHSRDATRLHHDVTEITPTTEMKPKKTPIAPSLKCFDSGSTSHRSEMIETIEGFCNSNKGRVVKKGDSPIRGLYGARCALPNMCFVENKVSVEPINDCDPFVIDGGSARDMCGHALRQTVDKCDQTGTSFKQGGILTTDCARWILDPSFNGPGAPKARYPLLNSSGFANTTWTNNTAFRGRFNSSSYTQLNRIFRK